MVSLKSRLEGQTNFRIGSTREIRMASTPALTSGRRHRVTTKTHSAEEHALDIIAKEAEARLAARRAARAEARDIRMKELEKQQKEADQQSDRHFELLSDPVGRNVRQTITRTGSHGGSSYAGSRRSSEDSTDLDSRELRHQVTDLEDKFRKAMIHNAQMDNEKSSLVYQVDMLKDELEEIEENYIELQKDYKEKCRDYDFSKRDCEKFNDENEYHKMQLEQRDKLMEEHGLVFVCADGEDESGELMLIQRPPADVLAPSKLTTQLLEQAGEGSLDVRLKRFADEKQELADEMRRLKLELDEEKMRNMKMEKFSTGNLPTNGPDMKSLETQKEATKQVGELKFKLQKSEQENAVLQSSVARLENQVLRFKSSAEASEKSEDELKAEKRKLQRENREHQSRIEDLETSNNHLQKRIDKLKTTRNAVTK